MVGSRPAHQQVVVMAGGSWVSTEPASAHGGFATNTGSCRNAIRYCTSRKYYRVRSTMLPLLVKALPRYYAGTRLSERVSDGTVVLFDAMVPSPWILCHQRCHDHALPAYAFKASNPTVVCRSMTVSGAMPAHLKVSMYS